MTDALVSGQFVHVLRVTASGAQAAGTRVSVLRSTETPDGGIQTGGTFINILRSTATNPLWVAGQYAEVLREGPVGIDSASLRVNVLRDADPDVEVAALMVQVMRATPSGVTSKKFNRAVTIIGG